MTHQATAMVEAPLQEAEAKMQQELEAAQTEAARQPGTAELLAEVVAQPGIKTPESEARTEKLGADVKTVAESSVVATLIADERVFRNIKLLGMVVLFCLQTKARMENNLPIIPEDTFGNNSTSLLFKYLSDQEDPEIDKCCIRGLGKSSSKTGNWNHSITSMWGHKGLQPWPPPHSLRTSCLSGRGVVLWTLVRWMGMARQQEDQGSRIGLGDAKSPLGKNRIRKESTCIRKGLINPVVLEEVKGLIIQYIRMSCIYG